MIREIVSLLITEFYPSFENADPARYSEQHGLAPIEHAVVERALCRILDR